MATINSFNHFSEVLQVRIIEQQDVSFEQGEFCVCGEGKYKPVVNGEAREEICPVCDGHKRVVVLIKGK
jgi:hypothetical protein